MKANLDRRDYFSQTKYAVVDIVKSVAVVMLFTYFFYRSIWALPLTVVVGVLFFCREREKRKRFLKKEFLNQFSECIQAIAVSMRAGYAVENAVLESILEIKMMFGEGSMMEKELQAIKEGLHNNIPLERLILNMAEKTELDFVVEFASVFNIAKRSGGNLPGVIENFAGLISEHSAIEEEMNTLLAGKRMEQNIMNVMPFAILFYVEWSNRGYFDSLYHNPTGVLIMSICMMGYLVAYWLSEKIVQGLFEWE